MDIFSLVLRCIAVYFAAYSEGNAEKGWNLVFKVATGGPFGIYKLYTSVGARNEQDSSVKALNNNIKDHYKSSIVDSWTKMKVTKVKLAVYDDSNEEAYIIFNGTGSNNTDWFNPTRILQSSYIVSDLVAHDNEFSIKGHMRKKRRRRFLIRSTLGGCKTGRGWLVVSDANVNLSCFIDTFNSTTIMYSPNASFAWYQDYKVAECLAIFVKQENDEYVPEERAEECNCSCAVNTASITINDTAELNKRLNQLKMELTVIRNSTSRYIGTKICARDFRPSATGIGTVLGGGILLGALCIIIMADILTWKNKTST